MSPLKYLIGTIVLLFLACGGEKDPAKRFQVQFDAQSNALKRNDTVQITVKDRDGNAVEGVSYSLNGKSLDKYEDHLIFNLPSLGNQELEVSFDLEGKPVVIKKNIRILAEEAPSLYTYEVVNEYPHDIRAFTQGLEFYQDTLYESTGRKGTSYIRKVDYKTGEILQQTALENSYFGEGITIMRNTAYQLSWQSRTGFLYDRGSLKEKGKFQYGHSREGWGLCNDGNIIYKSDGTEKIWKLNPETLEEEGFIQIVTNKSVFNKANELEYVDGKIYANVWQKESMMIIDAESGAIEGVINFGGLKERVKQHRDLDVLNGVAYHPERKTFFVTGKNWDKLFEVRIKLKE
ncbi:glutaminyl-peptide cyclotransferase [Lentiprolixibacter aurantiacus]|uniref:Glutaminyl-peptide cyclotransferase n=1 Tax=Lentiprolixibacter aurantiacus TaxID=2993939 RepID=A0AAE3SNE0_9FLAO|nr:glutaminyl-peptide cyclotransferase [Lentiprolixibacter aurantiacus]MCX2719415.1 glutaminyl-peptide cyclotransferase [Lentiprolixibacter aurantiacus]